MAKEEKKFRMKCRYCGGENVFKDAWASWDVDLQQWVVSSTFDNVFCNDCEGETNILEEVEIK